ncbi:transcription elongation factor SPT6 [Marchantia polymorpha subsp. ruderalis]|uniref:S1 motif domain-containing protein n=1 Tax=Marchantia polymorpha TaxID=3197 RepID=A0A2R6XBD1_MARPO|nr:hypothetical protein MARPO_0025s0106 [Marchantia polymorpha]BBN03708.1 hypothetical protein Mp_2g25720 [Marchantia polymorpha subsp. ruderalis]|eukprot:PTQ43424.1 hypothetical protein MARPO_0025s0106 [Marchantia polymorpha]
MGTRAISDDEDDEYEEEADAQDPEAGVDEDEDEEEDEEEGQDEYEKDGFIVDEDEDEEDPEEEEQARESSDDEAKAKKKKRKKRAEENDQLDEDDYLLLQEANVTGFHRPPPKSGNKTKFKRLKKAGKGGGDGDRGSRMGLSDDEEEEDEGGGRRGRTAEEELKRTLFGDDEGSVPPDDVAEEEEPEEEEEIGEEEDEMADFIVDEEELEDDGQPFRRKKTKKKKAPRQAPGISSFALQEAQDIFGDVSGLLEERRQREMDAQKAEMEVDEDEDGFGRSRPSKMLEKQFEPSLLEEKYMTERDDKIRDIDVAERLQLLEEVVGPFPTSDTSAREAVWIYERVFGSQALYRRPEFDKIAKMEKEEIVRQIDNVLHLIHEEKLEIPFIAMYRKEKCIDLLHEPEEQSRDVEAERRVKLKRQEVLWALHHWDKKWLLLRKRKLGLQAAYEKRNLVDSRRGIAREDLFQKLLEALSAAQSDQAVDDVDAKFNLHFPPDDVDLEPGQFKRPKRRSFYSVCRKAGLGSVAVYFGLTPEKFGENISAMYKRHEVEDEASPPEDVANGHVTGEFRDPLSVLKGARHMAAVEISTEPAVREYVRHVYLEKAVISTRPTTDGNTAIDAFHQYAGVKWLQNKPVSQFEDAQWLLIQKAEEEKLLEVVIGLPKNVTNEQLMPEFEAWYLSERVSRTAQLWNEQRRLILKDALHTMLLPTMEKEVRMILTARGKQWVSAQCGLELWKKVSVAPYSRADDDQMDYDEMPPRVMACCWGPGKPATTFVMLDAAGEIVNILHTGYLTIRAGSAEQQARKKQDQAKLLQFVKDSQPHVVVLGAANLACRHLLADIHEVTFKIVEEHPRDLAEGLDTINVVFGDETIPQLYENSHISEEQLVGHPGIVRRAVALGRFLQNPLAMLATLCGPSREVLSLKLHSMQSFLSPEEVYESVERVMVTVTNQVGIDVNLAASHDWLFAPLQFISGLGPRKATYIQRSIQGAGRVTSRKELLLALRIMGRRVFINAAGFIRVRGTGQASTGNQLLDPLDDTRIHPESYEVAKRMAEDAYCEEEGTQVEDMDDETLELAIEHVKKHPRYLASMDMEAYANFLAKDGPSRDLQTLLMIQAELQNGYQEWRVKYVSPTEEEAFFMLSGENEDTLTEGCLVHATVRKVQQNRVMCVLESGLMGIIHQKDLSDENNVDPADKVSEGSIVTCRVKEVNKAMFLVNLTCKGSQLRGENWTPRRPKDPYFNQDTSFLRAEQEKAKKKSDEEKRKAFKPRMIVHPQFQNVSLADAIEALAEKDVGEVIIRPSSKGPSHLSMTLKFYDGVYVNIDIVEGGKDSRDMTSFLRIGKTLTIGDDTFEDLDEVIARYVDPLVGHVKNVLRYRKFKRGSKAEVDDCLRILKKEKPMVIPYFFSICHEHPGAFRLSYIKSVSTVSHEYISVSPSGLKFRKRVFDTPEKLVYYFQKHFNESLPEVAPRRAVAAMVPPRSPAPSASGSFRSGGQWGPGRSGEGTGAGGWDGSNGWDRGGGRGRNSGWGRGVAAPGGGSEWDRNRVGANSGSGWDRAGPSSQGQGNGWNNWEGSGSATGYAGGRGGNMPPPSGQSGWDNRPQQAPHDGFKPGGNGWAANDTGFSDAASLTPISDSSWGVRKTATGGGSGWDSGGGNWDRPSAERTPSRSGWDSEQESQGTARSSYEATASKSGWDKPAPAARTGASGWEQSRGDPRRAGVVRDGSKRSGWDNPAPKPAGESQTGWDATPETNQSGGSSAMWEGSANPNARKADGTTSWDKPPAPTEQPNQSDSAWTSTEPNATAPAWGSIANEKGKEGSNWTQPSSASPAESGWGASQTDNKWDSGGASKEKPPGGTSDQAHKNTGWDTPSGEVGSKDSVSNWEAPKEKLTRSGWDSMDVEASESGGSRTGWDAAPVDKGVTSNWDQHGAKRQGGGERQRADPRRGSSGWDQPARDDTRQSGWDRPSAKPVRSQWDQPAYSPAQPGWTSEWDKSSNIKGSDSLPEHPPPLPPPPPPPLSAKHPGDSNWNAESDPHGGRNSGWATSEPGAPGVPESITEPAVPGVASQHPLSYPSVR